VVAPVAAAVKEDATAAVRPSAEELEFLKQPEDSVRAPVFTKSTSLTVK
jgi:hypothetical protein